MDDADLLGRPGRSRCRKPTAGSNPTVSRAERQSCVSLALDLSEELRPLLCERLALSLINRKQLDENDFCRFDNGAVILKEASRKAVLVAYQERKREQLQHAFLEEEKIDVGLLPYVQAQLLARHLRGDLDGYPPFLWK